MLYLDDTFVHLGRPQCIWRNVPFDWATATAANGGTSLADSSAERTLSQRTRPPPTRRLAPVPGSCLAAATSRPCEPQAILCSSHRLLLLSLSFFPCCLSNILMAAFAPSVPGWPAAVHPLATGGSAGRRRASVAVVASRASAGRLRMNAAEGGAGAPPVTVSRSGVEVHHFSPAVEALENEGRLAGPARRVLSRMWGRHRQSCLGIFIQGLQRCPCLFWLARCYDQRLRHGGDAAGVSSFLSISDSYWWHCG